MRTISSRLGYLAAVFSIAGLFQICDAPISAAAPNPDSCFTTTGTTSRTITDYNFAGAGCGATVEIPSTISGGTVVSVGVNAFNSRSITSVIIPSSVTSIGDYAFYNNQLASVIIPSSVTSMGNGVFANNQLTTVTIPNSVTSIADFVFTDNLLTSVAIPSTITSIGVSAFERNGLSSVAIPNSVTAIGQQAFNENQLTSVIIPNLVTVIEQSAFSSNQLTSVTIPSSVTTIGFNAFEFNKLTSVSIPISVTIIEQGAFAFNRLISVTIPNYVTSIGQSAFEGNQLTSVSLSNSLTTIGNFAFSANQLTSVTLPASVTSLGQRVFNLQNPQGGEFWFLINNSDSNVNQAIVDSFWYARLYTSNPSNPQNFTDDISFRTTELDGLDNDYNEQFNAGGHLVNPTSAEIEFVDGSDNQLLNPVFLTGQTSNMSTHFTDYLVKNGPNVPIPVNTFSPTLLELQAARTALSQYYREGSTLSYAASPVNGVSPTPASYSFVLGASTLSNQRQFVYAVATTSGPAGQLANTGINVWMIVAAAGVVILGNIGIIARR